MFPRTWQAINRPPTASIRQSTHLSEGFLTASAAIYLLKTFALIDITTHLSEGFLLLFPTFHMTKAVTYHEPTVM